MEYQIFQVIEGIILIIVLSFLPYEILKNGIKVNMYNLSYYLYNIFFILPELVSIIMGPAPLPLDYRGYRLTLGDMLIDTVWLIITVIIDLTLLWWVKRNSKKVSTQGNSRLSALKKQIKVPYAVRIVSYFLIWLPTVSALLAPQPSLYFSAFAAFYRKDLFDVTSDAVAWHNDVMGNAIYVAAIALIALWIDSEKKKTPFRIVLGAVAFQILWFSNKRTLGLLIIVMLLIIDILYSKKFPWFKTITVITGCIVYFVVYQNIAKASHMAVDNTFSNIYHLYFDRVIDMKLVIASLLYPDKIQILDYWGQSYLFDILVFIPRSIWENKPYPFALYYSAAFKIDSLSQVNGRFLTSFFAETIANFSWFGIPIGLFLYRKFIEFVEGIKNPLVYLFGVYTCTYLMITQIGSSHLNVAILIVLFAVLEPRTRKKLRNAATNNLQNIK